MAGYRIRAKIEGGTDHSLAVTVSDIEEALITVRAALETGQTSIEIVEEDRAIRDGRRAAGLSPDVRIVGEPRWRRVANTED